MERPRTIFIWIALLRLPVVETVMLPDAEKSVYSGAAAATVRGLKAELLQSASTDSAILPERVSDTIAF